MKALYSLVFVISIAQAFSTSSNPKKVALIGTTGQLGREAVQQLSNQGIAVKCLLRHDISNVTPGPIQDARSSIEVAASLSALPNVEFVTGDINDEATLRTLVEGTDACLALHGAVAPKPIFRGLIPLLFPETNPRHAKQVNYVGIQRLLNVMKDSKTCHHLVRITGKGENPWSIFSILINALGGLAKGWNYEAEQLIRRQSKLDYTILRPGIMKQDLPETQEITTLGLSDNGGDLPVTPVTYRQIAALAIDSVRHDTMKRATVTAMNVAGQSIAEIKPDTRDFPESLIAEHKKAARVGGLAILSIMLLCAQTMIRIVAKLFTVAG